ncbi:MAG: hypothetical protein NWQ38_06160 [Cellulophaga sp.]|nr:hypothetical protein [Cellulophaga sp.]
MKPKFKSLLFLSCFAFCALFYYQIEENDKTDDAINTNFAAIELIDAETNDLEKSIDEPIIIEDLN